jgi:hypothetical protein
MGKTMTRAQAVAWWLLARGWDGQRYSMDGRTLREVLEQAEAAHRKIEIPGVGTGHRYEWADGSAIVDTGGGWDVAHPDCTCGACWVGQGPGRAPECAGGEA